MRHDYVASTSIRHMSSVRVVFAFCRFGKRWTPPMIFSDPAAIIRIPLFQPRKLIRRTVPPVGVQGHVTLIATLIPLHPECRFLDLSTRGGGSQTHEPLRESPCKTDEPERFRKSKVCVDSAKKNTTELTSAK